MSNLKQQYDANGYHFPIRAFSTEQALAYRKQLENAESLVADDPAIRKLMQLQPAAVLDFADEIARLPSIIQPVTEILGNDVLLWNASFFIKEAQSPS